MNRKIALLFTMALLVLSYTNGYSQNTDAEIIKKLNRAWLTALVNKDTAALGNILADDFMLINPSGVKISKAASLSITLLPNQRVISIDIDRVQVRLLTADVGLVSAWTYNVVEAEGKKTILKICYQDVYMKRDEKWKAVAAHVTLLKQQ